MKPRRQKPRQPSNFLKAQESGAGLMLRNWLLWRNFGLQKATIRDITIRIRISLTAQQWSVLRYRSLKNILVKKVGWKPMHNKDNGEDQTSPFFCFNPLV